MDYDEIQELARELDRPISTLYVLDPNQDPFYIIPLRRARAEWFAEWWHRLAIPVGWHYRRIHYVFISQSPPIPIRAGDEALSQGKEENKVLMGPVYINTNLCWTYLNNAARDANYLGLVPLDAYTDRRNPDPIVLVQEPMDPDIGEMQHTIGYIGRAEFNYPPLPQYGELDYGTVPQPYHIEIWVEKSTMLDVLTPIARRYHLNIVTGVGELTATACRSFIDRIRNSDRPVRILYVSDFDPAGRSMPVAVARKIEFELHRQELDHDVQIRPIMLTHEQCVEFRLPRTPIKDTERRATHFEERFGAGATELDALEALHPGQLAQIITTEIERYWNPDHDDAVVAQFNELELEMDNITERVHGEHAQALEVLDNEISALNQETRELNRRAKEIEEQIKPLWQAMADKLHQDQPEPEIECPEFDAYEDDDPLFDSTREYVEQVGCYKAHQDRPTERRRRTARAPRRQATQQPYRPIRRNPPPPQRT